MSGSSWPEPARGASRPDDLAEIWARADTPVVPPPPAPVMPYGVKATAEHPVRLRRVGAMLIDWVVWALFFNLATWGQTVTPGEVLLWVAGSMAYYVILEWLCGATIGKGLMGLRVVRADGRSAGLPRILVRQVMTVVDALLVGYVVALVTRGHRRVGDFAAGTMIARAV